MASNILSVGQSALTAAQIGLSTTGHNIANASTPGYTRQVVMQGAVAGENLGYGFIGKGTEVVGISRMYNEFLTAQVTTAQTNKSQANTYYSQIQRINGMLADPTSGLSPALQDFFKGVQDVTSDPSGAASRQSLLSSAESLVSRFQSMSGQLSEMGQAVNGQVSTSVGTINLYSGQIAKLNDAIEKLQASGSGHAANDLLDQRDQAVAELSKQVKVNVIKQGDTYNVFVGNGQALVVANKSFNLIAASSPTDPGRIQVSYASNDKITPLPESAFAGGGSLGALLEFRTKTLDATQNELGRVATVLGLTFNAQHKLGQDQNGAPGTDFFKIAPPLVSASTANLGSGAVTATIRPELTGQLTGSDYLMQYIPASGADPAAYKLTRLSDNKETTFPPPGATIDGIDFGVSGSPTATDEFLIRPTVSGASAFGVALTNKSAIAAAAPVRTSVSSSNTGTAAVSLPVVSSVAALPTATLIYDAGAGTLSGFPASAAVTVSTPGSSPVTYPAGTAVPYTAGATISFSGVSFSISGAPAAGDRFSIGPNTNGVGDASNMLQLGGLQTARLLDNGTSTYQGAYSQMVNLVGNKTRELEATSAAADKIHTQAVTAQQGESGVNLDEEATNLIRYQQAYQAAAKMMQTASQLFDVLLSLGR